MTNLTSLPQSQLPPGSKISPLIVAVQAILDQFGTLEKFQRKYGEIFYAPKSTLFPPYVIFSNPQAIEKVFTADPNLFEINQQSNAPVRVLLGDNSLVLLNGKEHNREMLNLRISPSLATIMSQVELELLDNRPLKTTRRGFTFSPAGGVKMKVKGLITKA